MATESVRTLEEVHALVTRGRSDLSRRPEKGADMNLGRSKMARVSSSLLALALASGVLVASSTVAEAADVDFAALGIIDEQSTTGFRMQTVPGSAFGTVAAVISDDGQVATSHSTGGAIWLGSGRGLPNSHVSAIGCAPTCPNGADFTIHDVNASGTFAGEFDNAAGSTSGFVWSEADGYHDVDLAGIGAQIRGINDSGDIVGIRNRTFIGECDDLVPGSGVGTCTYFGTVDGMTAVDDSLNRGAQGIGNAADPPHSSSVVIGGSSIWSPSGEWVELAQGSVFTDINFHGDIVGAFNDGTCCVASYWRGLGPTRVEIGTLPGDSVSFARAINDDGLVVGWSGSSSDPDDPRRAFIWDADTEVMTDLGLLPGGTTATAFDINQHGLVAGIADGRPVIWDAGTSGYDVDYPPVAFPESIGVGLPGDLIEVPITIDDFDGDAFAVTVTDGPPGVEWDGATSSVRWQTSTGDSGTRAALLTVTQVGAPENSVPVLVQFELGAILTLDPIGNQTATVGDELTFTATSSAARPSYSMSGGSPTTPLPLPVGAALDPQSGVFTWTPTAGDIGNHQITIQVEDLDNRLRNQAASETFVIAVTGAPVGSLAGSVWEDADGNGTQDVGESPIPGVTVYLDGNGNGSPDGGETVTLSNAAGEYRFDDLVAGAYAIRQVVPTGHTQTHPGGTGAHEVNLGEGVALTDLDFGNQPVTVNSPPMIPPIADIVAIQGDHIVVDPMASDPEGDELAISWAGNPPTAIINGIFDWQTSLADPPGDYPITVTATEVGNPANAVSTSFTIILDAPPNLPPTIDAIPDQTAVAGNRIIVAPNITDAEGDPFAIAWEGSPPNAIINGIFIWTPDETQAPGTYPITVTATQIDTPANSGAESFDIDVLASAADDDLDGIANGVDGRGESVDTFVSEVGEVSTSFDDRHRTGPSSGFGTTFGELTASNGATLAIVDALDVADGVEVSVGGAPTGGHAVFEFCDIPGEVWAVSGTVSTHTCGSHQVRVESGLITLFTSDGAQVEVAAGSSISLDDQPGNVLVEVIAGQATITAGGTVTILSEGESVTNPGDVDGDLDDDGLTDVEETLTGTDPMSPDSDGDGLMDGIDASWLVSFLGDSSSSQFKRRWHKATMTLTVVVAAIAVNLGARDTALSVTASLHERIDGCGTSADGTDWLIDCDAQVVFRELLSMYERNVQVLPLPHHFPWP